jgi:hypothetical protein
MRVHALLILIALTTLGWLGSPNARSAVATAAMKPTRNQVHGYESYAEIHEYFASLVKEEPEFAEVLNLPWLKTHDGQGILVLKLGLATDGWRRSPVL